MNVKTIMAMASLASSLMFVGCIHVNDISKNGLYSGVMGHKFILKTDCYIVRFIDQSKPLYATSPLRENCLPEKVSPEYIHKRFGNFETLDILQKGAIFKIVGVEEERTPVDISVSYKAELQTPSFQGMVLDVFFLTDSTKSPPLFIENLVGIAPE